MMRLTTLKYAKDNFDGQAVRVRGRQRVPRDRSAQVKASLPTGMGIEAPRHGRTIGNHGDDDALGPVFTRSIARSLAGNRALEGSATRSVMGNRL